MANQMEIWHSMRNIMTILFFPLPFNTERQTELLLGMVIANIERNKVKGIFQ